MYKHEYQRGASVEILSCQGKDPLSKWKVSNGSGSAKRTYDKDIKGFVCHLEGSTATSKLQLPKDSVKQTLCLTQRYLMLQIFIPSGKDFSIELSMCDTTNSKRRLLMSTSIRDMSTTPLHAKLNLSVVKRNVWLNLCFDLSSLMTEIFLKQTFKSLDVIVVGGNCKVRKIFTMRDQPPDSTDSESVSASSTNGTGDSYSGIFQLENVPPHLQYGSTVAYLTQVINVKKIKAYIGRNDKPDIHTTSSISSSDFNKPLYSTKMVRDPYLVLTNIAFGTHVKVDSAASMDKKSSRSALAHRERRAYTPRTDLESVRSEIHEGQNDVPHINLNKCSNRVNNDKEVISNPGGISNPRTSVLTNKSIVLPSWSASNHSSEQLPSSLAMLVDEIDLPSGGNDEHLNLSDNVASFSSRPHAAQKWVTDSDLQELDTNDIGLNEDFRKSDSSDSDDNFSERVLETKSHLPSHSSLRSHGLGMSPKSDRSRSRVLVSTNEPRDIASRPFRKYNSLEYSSEPDVDEMELKNLSMEDGFSSAVEQTKHLRDSDTTLISSVDTLLHYSMNKESEVYSEDSLDEQRMMPKHKPHDVSGSHGITVSKKTLREISQSAALASKPGDASQSNSLQVGSWSESFEEHMLSRMKEEHEEEMIREEEHKSSGKGSDSHGQSALNDTTFRYDDSDMCNGSFDASWSTWKQPPPLNSEVYAHEMKGSMPVIDNMDTLSISFNCSDARKSANLRSPPIVLPSDRAKQEKDFASVSDVLGLSDGSTVSGHSTSVQESDEEEMLDLMYDPCLNCYFDPKSGRYYELKG